MNLPHPPCYAVRILLLALVFATAPLPAAEPAKKAPAPTPAPAPGAVQFTPPKTKAIGLKRQVNAGSRSGGRASAVPVALVPDGLGLSASEQPVLWWFLSQPTTAKVEFTLNHRFETLIKFDLPDVTTAGLHRVDLASLTKQRPVKLTPGTPYEWTVRVKQGDDPATDPVTVGWVEFRPVETDLQTKLGTVSQLQRPALYATEGYWYDAVNLLASPKPHPDLPPLLRQVGLLDVVVTVP